MKENSEQQFTPDQVEELIEKQLADRSQKTPEARFLEEMQRAAQHMREEHEQALKRVEKRLVKYVHMRANRATSLPPERQQPLSSPEHRLRHGGSYSMMQKRRLSETGPDRARRHLSLFAAIITLVVLVGSLALIRTLHQGSPAQIGIHTTATVTATPTPTPEGTVVYAITSNSNSVYGFTRLSWSPDSQRIASLDTQGVLKIWDATTGKHSITVSMPDTQEMPHDISWSPDGKLLAVATGPHILLVNSQSGAIFRKYAAPTTTASISSGTPHLSATLPRSGDTVGFNEIAWSPDGRWFAASLTITPPTFIKQVLDAQTGRPVFTLPGDSDPAFAFAWSSDSRYLAAAVANHRLVWNMSTHQIVASYPQAGGTLAWQPGTHNLALVKYIAKPEGGSRTAIAIWNPLAGKEVRQFPTAGENFASGSLAWSPDGLRLIYGILPANNQQKDLAVIIDAITGRKLYAYPQGNQHCGALVDWSPDGKYIVSGASGIFDTAGTKAGAQVWIA